MSKGEFKIKVSDSGHYITMSPSDIKVVLMKAGKSVADLARTLDKKRNLVSMVLHGHRSNPEIRNGIAREISKLVKAEKKNMPLAS
jgi:hypothetical protein